MIATFLLEDENPIRGKSPLQERSEQFGFGRCLAME
jgi:hypothetical protein